MVEVQESTIFTQKLQILKMPTTVVITLAVAWLEEGQKS